MSSLVLNAHLRAVQVYIQECCLMTPDRYIAFKTQFEIPTVASQPGSSWAAALDQLWKFWEEVGGGYPQISRNQLTPAASPNSEESKHIYKIKWAVITEGEMPCSLTALGELPVSIIQTSSSFFRPWIREEWSWAPLRVQSSLHSTLSAPSLSANIFGDKIRESWLCTV